MLPIGTLLLIGSFGFIDLMSLPVFEDEGSQLRWVYRSIEAREWLQALNEGKPLEVWPMVLLIRLGVQPVAAIRALHVLIGVVGAVLTYRLGTRVSSRASAWAAATLFAVCPFIVYLERLALSDVLLCTAGIWVLLRILAFLDSPTWPHVLTLAVSLLIAACCKLPVGFIFIISLPLALAALPEGLRRCLLERRHRLRLLAAQAPVALLALGVICVALIRWQRGLSPGFGLQDLFGIGLGGYRNIAVGSGGPRPDLVHELTAQLSAPVAAVGLVGLAAGAIWGDWRQRWLIATGVLPMLAIGLLAKFWFSRYLLFTLPPLIVAAVCGWRSLAQRAGRLRRAFELGALLGCLVLMVHRSVLIILDPAAANWSPLDRYQYVEGPGSGYGYPEAAQFILTAPRAPSNVYSLDGHSAYQLRNYLPADWRRRVSPVFYARDGKVLRSEEERLANLLSCTPAWLVVSKQLLPGYLIATFGEKSAERLQLRPIAEFDKPGRRTQLAIYEISGF